jgi:hypothetical protein
VIVVCGVEQRHELLGLDPGPVRLGLLDSPTPAPCRVGAVDDLVLDRPIHDHRQHLEGTASAMPSTDPPPAAAQVCRGDFTVAPERRPIGPSPNLVNDVAFLVRRALAVAKQLRWV